jgi:hypothetical protein
MGDSVSTGFSLCDAKCSSLRWIGLPKGMVSSLVCVVTSNASPDACEGQKGARDLGF